jgi:hypothetical protein
MRRHDGDARKFNAEIFRSTIAHQAARKISGVLAMKILIRNAIMPVVHVDDPIGE